jgi:hypothetical protein
MDRTPLGDRWAFGQPHQPFVTPRKRRWSGLATVTVIFALVGSAALAADIQTDAVLSSNSLVPTEVAVGSNAFDIKVWATGTVPSDKTGDGYVVNQYNMATTGTITAGTTVTLVHFTPGTNYSSSTACPASGAPQGCASNPFVINANLQVATGTAAGTTGTLTVATEGTPGLSADSTPDQGFVRVGATNSAPVINRDNASVTVSEGATATNTGTWSDANAGDTVTLTASVGDVTKSGTNASGTWNWSFDTDDGPFESQTVTITANDGTGAANAVSTTSFALIVNNVPPTVTSVTPNKTIVIAGENVTFTGSATDPSGADTTAGFRWSFDGGAYGGVNANTYTTSFSLCGSGTITAKAKDKDGGESAPATSGAVAVYDAAYLSPLREGVYNLVQKGRVVPVKVSIGCGGFVSGLSPKIQLLTGDIDPDTDPGDSSLNVDTTSVSGADTTGIMREVDGQYIYNLLVPSAAAGTKFTIRVNLGGGAGGAYVVLQIRK